MKRVWLMMAVAAASALTAAAARADFEPTAWQRVRDITLPDGAAGLNARFAVDADVWENAQGPDFADLRILAGETEEVGLALFTPEEAAPALTRPPQVAVTRDGPKTQILLDFGKELPVINRIYLLTAGGKFKCAATVEASADGGRLEDDPCGRGDLLLRRGHAGEVHDPLGPRHAVAVSAGDARAAGRRRARRGDRRHGLPRREAGPHDESHVGDLARGQAHRDAGGGGDAPGPRPRSQASAGPVGDAGDER